MTAHVLSPEGEWIGFEDFDPAAVEAVKALLTGTIEAAASGSLSTENQLAPAVREHPGAVASTCQGGTGDG